MQRELPQPGQFYRHFQNKLYQIIAIAAHAETGEQLVIYQALFGDFKIYAHTLTRFLEPVDKTLYPNVKQTWCFQRVSFASKKETVPANTASASHTSGTSRSQSLPSPITFDSLKPPKKVLPPTAKKKEDNPSYQDRVERVVTSFIEAASYEDKLRILEENRDHCDSHMLESMAYLIDHSLDGKTTEDKYEDLHNILTTLIHFESSRLR